MAVADFALQLLEAGDFDAIRGAIDSSIDSAVLPDDLIASAVYGPSGESDVFARDANAKTYESGATADAVKWVLVRRAAVRFTAARLCGALPILISEKIGPDSYTLKPFDPEKRAAALISQANADLATYLEADGQTQPYTFFTLASGCRGR